MYPYLFGVEALPTYGFLLAVGLLAAVLLFKFICAKKKADDDAYTFYSLTGIISIALGIGGAVLFQSFYDMFDRIRLGQGVSFKLGGMTFMGGLITGVISFVAGTAIFAKPKVKREFFRCGSYAAPCIVIGHMFGRLGCFCAGCCYGKPTDSALGVVFPDLRDYPYSYPAYVATGGRAYPTQLFEALFLAVLLAVMLFLLFKFDNYKILLPLYGMAYAVFRFCIEFLRGDHRGTLIPGLTPSQTQVIVLAAVSVALAVCVYRFDIVPFANCKDKPQVAAAEQAPPDADMESTPTEQPPHDEKE